MLTQLIFWLALIILPLSAPLILWGTSLPFSMYAMHIIFVFVCAGVYYTDRHLLVRRLLFKKHRLAFILANIALLALGTCLTFLSVRLLLKAPGKGRGQEAESGLDYGEGRPNEASNQVRGHTLYGK